MSTQKNVLRGSALVASTNALLATLNSRDKETHRHTRRVTKIADKLSRELSFTTTDRRNLKIAAALHDIGKLDIPTGILKKPTKHTIAEQKIMREHVTAGSILLRSLRFPLEIISILEQHHEKFDGTGYPQGLSGEQIDVAARVLIVADTFDAVVSNRVYRSGAPYSKARGEITGNANTQFDPLVVAAFVMVPKIEWERILDRRLD